jgi:hypothetical protein
MIARFTPHSNQQRENETAMSSVNDRTTQRGSRQQDKREIAFFVRAKTGPGMRDWSPVGVAFARRNGAPGFTVKLNTLPIGSWSGALVLVPPLDDVEDLPIEE